MDSNWCMVSPIISTFILLLCFTSSICSVHPVNSSNITHNFRVGNESRKSNYIEALLKKINKPAVKTFQANGDIIDCVPSHLQPAFDHPLLKGQKPLSDPTEMPQGHNTSNTNMFEDNFQVWSISGESCPENTIPIKRTTEQDVLRATSVREFGQKVVVPKNHDHAIGKATGDFYGAKAILSVWDPTIEDKGEFSLSQMWVMAGTYGEGNLNTIEAGWQVFPGLYGDSNPRLFVYWTKNAYQGTGCYNLICPGFVQTSRIFVPGGQIQPVSSYNGAQYEYIFLVWKDPKTGNWWLNINNENVGYWPSSLFTLLKDQASKVEFGGEVYGGTGPHTKTQMGSGHFPTEGYKKAAYIRNIQLVNNKNELYSAPRLGGVSEKPNCYSAAVSTGIDPVWGNYLYYGGPGGANPGVTAGSCNGPCTIWSLSSHILNSAEVSTGKENPVWGNYLYYGGPGGANPGCI